MRKLMREPTAMNDRGDDSVVYLDQYRRPATRPTPAEPDDEPDDGVDPPTECGIVLCW